MVVVQGQADLLEIIQATRPVGGFAHLLNRRQQETDKDSDDRDHHQQFDQREARSLRYSRSFHRGLRPNALVENEIQSQ